MKVTIKGLTDSTITFNKIGFTLRGNYRKLEQFPNSVASNIEISTKEQIDELNGLVSARLIEVTEEKQIIVQMPSLSVSNIAGTTSNINVKIPFTIESVKQEQPEKTEQITETTSTTETTIIHDEPKAEPKAETKVEQVTVKEVESKSSSKLKKIKKISSKNNILATVEKPEETSSVTVVATPSGPVKTGTFKTPDGALDNSSVVDESLKAAEDMDIEDKKEDDSVDELKLDESERMGNEAVVATGRNSFKKTQMKRSSVDGQEEMKKTDPFIDKEENELKDKSKPAFIEDPKDDVDPEAFIEI